MVEFIYDNLEHIDYYISALQEINIAYRLNEIKDLRLDINQPPDNIIYINCVTPSAFHRYDSHAIINLEQYLEYLSAYNRLVINDQRSLNLEMSKVEQLRLFKRTGLVHPLTVFSSEPDELTKMAHMLPLPVILKNNCSRNGTGIKVFDNINTMENHLKSAEIELSPDNIMLVQEYIKPKADLITRVLFLNNTFLYTYRTSAIIDQPDKPIENIFLSNYTHPLMTKYREMAQAVGYSFAEIEYIESTNGTIYTTDINGTFHIIPEIEKASDELLKTTFQNFIISRT